MAQDRIALMKAFVAQAREEIMMDNR